MQSMTLVDTLDLNDDATIEALLQKKCDYASQFGYRLAAVYPHLDRLVLVFQLDEDEFAARKQRGEHLGRPRV